MKRILLLALALAMLTVTALAEGSASSYPFGSFALTVPEDVTVEEYDTTITVVRGQTRVVVQVIPQELEEDGQEQVRGLMPVYSADISDVTDVTLVSGVYGAMGLIEDHFGEGIHEVPMLILTEEELLILSGYDFDGDTLAVHTLLTELLSGVTLAGEPILPAAAAEETNDD
ncbi:MAG: hypothetical protein J1E43_07465 [Christensenellaceae bacterium]|nr:hypothetical protein [Christensenellaceae bacterium]